MALPFGADDLNKLKGFIDFVTQNPTILNMPQLDFVKKFVEKFGGKVPSGEFKMPAGGKCPFGGDDGAADGVKSEPTPADPESDPEVVEMESDPESEVELDMEVEMLQDYDYSHPGGEMTRNAVYLQESTSKKTKKRKDLCQQLVKATKKPKLDLTDYEDLSMYHNRSSEEDDPINTTEVEVIIKSEEFDEQDDYYNDTDEFNECVEPKAKNNSSDDYDDDETDFEDDDDLDYNHTKTQHVRRITRSIQNAKVSKVGVKSRKLRTPKPACHETCKHKCNQNIDNDLRWQLCAEFAELNRLERKDYILKWVETKPMKMIRVQRKKDRAIRNFTNNYFLKGRDGERIRVCLKFFLATLVINNYTMKLYTMGRAHVLPGKECKIENIAIKADDATNKEIAPFEPQKAPQPKPPKPKVPKEVQQEWNKYKKAKGGHSPKPLNCTETCQFKCSTHFSQEQRIQLCTTFWNMDYKRRKDFVLSRIESREIEMLTTPEYRKTTKAARAWHNKFYFRGPRGENIRICQRFLTSTLCISHRFIKNAIKNYDKQTGTFLGEDMRGKNSVHNKIPNEMAIVVKQHIESYPTWVPQKNYKTRYLHSTLNIQRMYIEYKQFCEEKKLKPVSSFYYRKVFHEQFRLEFLKPTVKYKPKVNKEEIIVLKKTNPNISAFTGDELGGFWTQPKITSVPSISRAEKQLKFETASEMPSSTSTNKNQSMQENVQQASTLHTNSYFALPNSLQSHVDLESEQLNSFNTASGFINAALDQQSAVFRML